MTHMEGSSTSFLAQLTIICRQCRRNKKKLNLDDSRNQTYDSFTNNSLENFKDSMKIEDCLELLIKNQENNS